MMGIFLCWLLWPIDTEFLELPYSTYVNDSQGKLLSASIASDEQWRFPVIEELPEKFAQAIIVYEDKRFLRHPGIDPFAIARAAKQNIQAQKVVSGASTLTMQLARLISHHPERSILYKLLEMRIALRLELWYDKEEILRWYSSLAPFGGNVVGLEAACWRYYSKPPEKLSWAEAATLAVLPNAPALIHVNRNRDQLLTKRDYLLGLLHQEGRLDAMDLEAALIEPLPSKTHPLPQEAPHLLDLKRKGVQVDHVNIDHQLQQSSASVMNQLYDEWRQNEIYNAAVMILDTKSGDVLAYHGNVPMTTQEQSVDMIQARRSSGSILKPFLYAHMIDRGMITPEELVWDIPTYISGFNPTNYNKTYAGAVPVDEALQRSLNVPFVRLLRAYGISPFLERLGEHGLSTLDRSADHYGLSLILGGGEVTLWDLVHAYRKMGAALIDKDEDYLLSLASVYKTLDALKGLNRPDEEGDWQRMSSRASMAWKTGTSYGHRDAWAIGVHPELTIGVWVGNADGEGREGIIGTKTAGRLLFALAGKANLSNTWFDEPLEEMRYLRKCHHSGLLASSTCEKVDTVLWPGITERAEVCTYHRSYVVTEDDKWRLDGDCHNDLDAKSKAYLELPVTVAYYYKRSHPEWSPVPPLSPGCRSHPQDGAMDIVYPEPNELIYLPKDLNAAQQSLIVRVAHTRQQAKLYWYLDDNYKGETRDFHSYAFLPEAGDHVITVVDDAGYKLSRKVTILRG